MESGISNKRHQYLPCPKIGQKRHSSICEVKGNGKGGGSCKWLRFDEAGLARCDFVSTSEKRVDKYQAKKGKKNAKN